MTFVVHFNFQEFLKMLNKGATVHSAVYALKDKPTGTVLLTSDAGIAGGTIHAILMNITGDNPKPLAMAVEAFDKIEALLESQGLTTSLGVIMTSGLQEALRYFGTVINYSLTDVDELVAPVKEVASK